MVFLSSGVASLTRRQPPLDFLRGTAWKEARSIPSPRAREVRFHCTDSARRHMNGSRAAFHLPVKTPLIAFADLTNGVTVSRFETTPTRQTAALAQ